MKTETEIILRTITKSDLEWARKLRNKNRTFFFDHRLISKKQQQNWFTGLTYSFFVIECNGESIGTISIRKVLGRHEIHNVIIDKKHRRKGIIKRAIAILEEKYGTPLFVDVHIRNSGAVAAYKKLGFQTISYRMKKI